MLILLEIVAKRMETWFESDRPVVARSVKEGAMNKSNHLSAASYSKDFISKRTNERMNEMTREFGNLNLKLQDQAKLLQLFLASDKKSTCC